MHNMNLGYATTQDLIDELITRNVLSPYVVHKIVPDLVHRAYKNEQEQKLADDPNAVLTPIENVILATMVPDLVRGVVQEGIVSLSRVSAAERDPDRHVPKDMEYTAAIMTLNPSADLLYTRLPDEKRA